MDSSATIGTCNVFSVRLSPICNRTSTTRISFGHGFRSHRCGFAPKITAAVPNGSVSSSGSQGEDSRLVKNAHKRISSLESLFCYDKPIPEERIETPVGVALVEKAIGENIRCADCEAKGAVLCSTCSGSGLYVDSIMESQGIIVKVRCLGCGGTGNIMCSDCGGRGHLGCKQS
ncbi:unnamed protein product [Linum trigynum]|uniref:BSD2 cysteine rich domain-containing protein n=1 Tax=Linum trigynum TaxID=586398 RepID=A0AAV2CL01_9ROSI